jgi:DNA-binding NarL/FixJ family response regulator
LSLCLECYSHGCPHLSNRSRNSVLSDSELRVLQLVAAGDTNQSAAFKLQTTEGAVKVALNRIYRKLRFESEGNARVHLALWARDHEDFLRAA